LDQKQFDTRLHCFYNAIKCRRNSIIAVPVALARLIRATEQSVRARHSTYIESFGLQQARANVIVIGGFIERRYTFTGEDGKQYEIEISDSTVNTAKSIIQNIIDSYQWM
jgi:hypothetical protein